MEVNYLDLVGEGYMGSMQWQLANYERQYETKKKTPQICIACHQLTFRKNTQDM